MVALGYVDAALAVSGDEFEVAILGEPHKAILQGASLFDPTGSRLRS